MTGGEANIRHSYPFFAAVMVVIGLANFLFIRWLERRDWKKFL